MSIVSNASQSARIFGGMVTSTLLIFDVADQDLGIYLCHGSNNLGVLSQEFNLTGSERETGDNLAESTHDLSSTGSNIPFSIITVKVEIFALHSFLRFSRSISDSKCTAKKKNVYTQLRKFHTCARK